ncbi:MAG: hypothetical protein ABIQ70_13405 [Dokdonella sp.]
MTAIRLDSFGGVAPILDPRKLPNMGATIAHDCKFDGGDMRPLFSHLNAGALPTNSCRLFKYRYKGSSYWLSFPNTGTSEVDAVISPIANDSLGRLYWSRVSLSTINSGAADNYPRCASQPTANDITGNTAVVRKLGVQQPTVAPTLTETQVANSITSQGATPTMTNMSQTSPVTVTANAHPFQNGWRVIVAADGTTDAGMSETAGLTFIIGNVTASTFDLLGTDGVHYTKFTVGATHLKISRVYLDADMETRSYVYTYVTDWGEEGPPSPASTPRDIRYDSKVQVNWTAPIGSLSINRARIYRTATGTDGSGSFFFVAEVALPAITYLDGVLPISLGESLPSATWSAPPNGLRGLVQMPNGFMCGFVGNTLWFSEPYQPHAWPPAYCKTTQDEIVGTAVFGTTLVVGTVGRPYLAIGTDPLSVSMQQLDLYAPCLNKGGMCSAGTSVMYPTPEGLAFITSGDERILTLSQVARKQWSAMWSLTMEAIFYDGRYVAFSQDAKKTLIVETEFARVARTVGGDPPNVRISDATVQGRAPAIDPDDESLNYAIFSGGGASSRGVFEGGATRLTADWKSKVFTMPHAINLSLARVYASGYPVTLKIGYANLRSNGQTLGEVSDTYTVVANGSEPFRLPGNFLSREFQVEVLSAFDVQSVTLTDNTDDLRAS